MALWEASYLGLYGDGLLYSDCVVLDVKQRIQDRVNKGYGWLERNPVTGLLVAGGLSGVAVLGVVGLSIYSQQTFVAKTACTKDPASAACAAIREDVARAEPIRNPCIGYQRVTRTRGRACPKDYVDLRRKRNRDFQIRSKSIQDLDLDGDGGPTSAPADEHVGGSTGGVDSGHSKGTSGGSHHPSRHPSSSPPPPSSPPIVPPAESPPPPPSQPGNSGSAASAEHGLDVCIELAVSACVKSDVELPVHLP